MELRVERERQAMDRKTNKHRTISWNSAAKDKSRMQGITRKRGMAEESLLVALMSKLEEMPSKASRRSCRGPEMYILFDSGSFQSSAQAFYWDVSHY